MPRTVPQPAPSALGGLPGLLDPAFLSQQAMEMLLVRQFNQKVGETSGVYRSNFFFFFPSQNEGINSAGEKYCFCLFFQHLSCAVLRRGNAGPPALANTTRHFASIKTKHTQRKKKQFTPCFSGRNQGN